VAQAVEWFLALTGVIVGLSHIVQRHTWSDGYGRLSRVGLPGALINGAISLVPGAIVVTGHTSWAWPYGGITAFGWLLVLKGAISFLAPDAALKSMAHGGRSPQSFIPGGAVLLCVSAWAAWCAWLRWSSGI